MSETMTTDPVAEAIAKAQAAAAEVVRKQIEAADPEPFLVGADSRDWFADMGAQIRRQVLSAQ